MANEILEGQIGSGKGPEPTPSEGAQGQGDTAPQAAEGQGVPGSPQAGSEPENLGLPEGMTLDALPGAYKSLQAEYTKNQQSSKDRDELLAPFGGHDAMVQWGQYLTNNPSFEKWVEAEKQKRYMGDSASDVDEETQKAIQTVERIADQKAQQLYQDRVAPIENSLKQERLEGNMSKMDVDPTYEDWRTYQDKMAEIAEKLPTAVQDNPSLDDLQDLYWRAVRQSGKFQQVMAKSYENELKSKQSKSTDRPVVQSGQGAVRKSNTIAEAFAQAKQATG